jgi:hypothetical protein
MGYLHYLSVRVAHDRRQQIGLLPILLRDTKKTVQIDLYRGNASILMSTIGISTFYNLGKKMARRQKCQKMTKNNKK